MRKLLLGSGGAAMVLAVVWWFAAPRLWGDRLPPGWEWRATFIGVSAWVDAKTGVLPEDTASMYTRTIRIASEEGRPRAVRMEDAYLLQDPKSGSTVWEYVPTFEIDPATGRHLSPEHRGDIFVFPRGTGKTTYRLRMNYLKGVPLAFRREEIVEGVTTYMFEYRGRAEYTESYAGTPQYPGVKVEAGQEIRCADDQLVVRLWIEPVTGEMLKIEESCLSGDAVYDTASGTRVATIMRWGGETAGDDVQRRAERIQAERSRLLWRLHYGPGVLLALGTIVLALGWRGGGGRRL